MLLDLDELEKSKYTKLFVKENEYTIGIHNTRIKALAKRKSYALSIPSNVKLFPKEIKSGTKIFTKMEANSSSGSANTSAGYCLLINVKNLSTESRRQILCALNRDDLFENLEENDQNIVNDEMSEDLGELSKC